MAKEEAEGASGEPKGLAEAFLGVLGVVDIVLGGLALYALHAAHPATTATAVATELFRTTGSPYVDGALLVSAAAVAGKLVCLLASFVGALIGSIAPGKARRLTLSLLVAEYQVMNPVEAELASETDTPEDRALAYLEHARSPAARRCGLVRDNAVFAYGAALLAVGMTAGLGWPLLVVAALLGCMGCLTYRDLEHELAIALRAVVAAQRNGGATLPRDPALEGRAHA
jgi:hypothetical protein